MDEKKFCGFVVERGPVKLSSQAQPRKRGSTYSKTNLVTSIFGMHFYKNKKTELSAWLAIGFGPLTTKNKSWP